MGNTFSNHPFPCQICGDIFMREISGTLLCKDCSIRNQFLMLEKDEKLNFILSCSQIKTLSEKKEFKGPNFQSNFSYREIVDKLKTFEGLGKEYRLIKSILKHLNFHDWKGIYIYIEKDDLLFVHHPDIQSLDKILSIDFTKIVNQLYMKRYG
jgi:hypothetical protein